MLEYALTTHMQTAQESLAMMMSEELIKKDIPKSGLRKIREEITSAQEPLYTLRRLLPGTAEIFSATLQLTPEQHRADARKILTAVYDQVTEVKLPIEIAGKKYEVSGLELEVINLLLAATPENQAEIGVQALSYIAFSNGHTIPSPQDRLLLIKYKHLLYQRQHNPTNLLEKPFSTKPEKRKKRSQIQIKTSDGEVKLSNRGTIISIDLIEKSFKGIPPEQSEDYLLSGESLRLMFALAKLGSFSRVNATQLFNTLGYVTDRKNKVIKLIETVKKTFGWEMKMVGDMIQFSSINAQTWGKPKINVIKDNSIIKLDFAEGKFTYGGTETPLTINETIVLSELLFSLIPNECYPNQRVPLTEFQDLFELTEAAAQDQIDQIVIGLKLKLKAHPIVNIKTSRGPHKKSYYLTLK